jgi:exosortase
VVETLLPIPPDSQPEAAIGNTAPISDRGQPPTPSGRLAFLSPWQVTLAVVAIVLGWSYAPNLRSLVAIWNEEPNYSHGFLVVPVVLVIVWRRWVEEDPPTLRPSWWGWAGLAVMLVVRAVCYERGAEWTETATLLPVVACLTLAAGGWPLLRRVWPAIAFLVFLLPLPLSVNSILAQPLQRVATTWSTALLKLTGLWVVAEGNVILVGGDQLEVAAACNGLSMLMCLAATVAAMTILVPMAVWKRVALFLSIIPIALVSNVLRIAATAWCYHLFGAKVGGHFAHDAAGWLMMPVALILVGLELALLSWLVIEVEELPAGRPDHLLRRRPT